MEDKNFDTKYSAKCDVTNRKIFECTYKDCNKSYNRGAHLKRHIDSTHNTNKQESMKLK